MIMEEKNQMERENGRWIPMLDYAVSTGVSMSTLRRYIKANKVRYRMENGKYLLWDREQEPETKIRALQQELLQAHEEINELKMLVALYEEKIQTR